MTPLTQAERIALREIADQDPARPTAILVEACRSLVVRGLVRVEARSFPWVDAYSLTSDP